jgi:hypothetical protein
MAGERHGMREFAISLRTYRSAGQTKPVLSLYSLFYHLHCLSDKPMDILSDGQTALTLKSQMKGARTAGAPHPKSLFYIFRQRGYSPHFKDTLHIFHSPSHKIPPVSQCYLFVGSCNIHKLHERCAKIQMSTPRFPLQLSEVKLLHNWHTTGYVITCATEYKSN